MSLRRPFVLLGLLSLLCACDSLSTAGADAAVGSSDRTEPAPLPADLVAACPEAARFDRAGRAACTEIGCVNGYMLNVSPSSGWSAGAYRFDLTVDGSMVTCQGSLPLNDCGTRSFRCDADGVSLGESGCALPAGQQGIASVRFEGFPLAVSVRVQKDGVELVSTELKPAYKAGQPNGAGCEPICCGASGELMVPAQ